MRHGPRRGMRRGWFRFLRSRLGRAWIYGCGAFWSTVESVSGWRSVGAVFSVDVVGAHRGDGAYFFEFSQDSADRSRVHFGDRGQCLVAGIRHVVFVGVVGQDEQKMVLRGFGKETCGQVECPINCLYAHVR